MQKSWIALKESETTSKSDKFRRARTFVVHPDVDPSGRIYMEAHIKLTPGGSPSPRIHFYDDTSGATGKIHIGWIGDQLQNQSTN